LLGAFAIAASGCASSPGAFASATTQTSPARESSSSTHINVAALRDSLRAQQIADQEGPRVSIHAELSSFASSRRVRTTFRLDDDAYVAVGHLGPDGVVRIIFPIDPSDNGLVEGGKTYRLPEISAGYLDMYRWRNATYSMYRSPSAQHDSYDAGYGYVFVIAAWRPMRFDRFSESGEWNSFEVADELYLRDPRPAIYELATLLTGENREAYTVKFANYFSTMNSGWGYGSSSFTSTYCLGYEPLGYSIFGNSDVWGRAAFNPRRSYYGTYSGYFYYGSSRYAYRYDAAQGCYRTYLAPIVQYADAGPAFMPKGPFTPKDTNAASGDGPRNRPVLPIGGIRPRLRDNPLQPKNAAPGEAESSEYRRRGLITDNAGGDRAARRESARPAAGSTAGAYARPAIQEMMNRRREMADQNTADRNPTDGYRPSPRNGGVNGRQSGNGYNPPTRFEGPRRESGSETRTESTSERFSRPTPATPSARPESPRSEPIRTEIRRPEAPPRPADAPRAESRPPEPPPSARPPESSSSRPPEPAPASRPPGDRQP
jgi:hypothetical protein